MICQVLQPSVLEVTFLVKKKMRGFFKNVVFEPLDLSDHHQNLYTCSEHEYCIPVNFHRDRTTPGWFLVFGFLCVTPVL